MNNCVKIDTHKPTPHKIVMGGIGFRVQLEEPMIYYRGLDPNNIRLCKLDVIGLMAFYSKVYKAVITSAFRSKELNQSVNGNPNSKHLIGQAFDLSFRDYLGAFLDENIVINTAKYFGFTALKETDHYHIQRP